MKSKFFSIFPYDKNHSMRTCLREWSRREIYKRMGEMGGTTALNRREGMSSQIKEKELALSRSTYSGRHTSGQSRKQHLRKHEGDKGICRWTPSVWLFLSFSIIKQVRFLPGIHFKKKSKKCLWYIMKGCYTFNDLKFGRKKYNHVTLIWLESL